MESRIAIREGTLHLARRERDKMGAPGGWMRVNVQT